MSKIFQTPSTKGGSPRQDFADDGPVIEFCHRIETTAAEDWTTRTDAFSHLVGMIPEGTAYSKSSAWYNNPALLRHLAIAVSELLKDARSSVVKRTCENLIILFNRCQGDARYLFKDMMPTILSVHAQTVQVVRTAVQNMVAEAIPEVPCKMVMPLWMDRLKVDKSRTVREACAFYLGLALQSWTTDGYLTDEIWMQVGNVLVRTLRDPSPQVRVHAKAALQYMSNAQRRLFDELVNDPEGPSVKDPKVQKWLKSLGNGNSPDSEDLSVASKFSYNSDTRYAARAAGTSTFRSGTPRKAPPRTSSLSSIGFDDDSTAGVPKSIAVVGRRAGAAGLGPPLRRVAPVPPAATKPMEGNASQPPLAPKAVEIKTNPAKCVQTKSSPPRPPPLRIPDSTKSSDAPGSLGSFEKAQTDSKAPVSIVSSEVKAKEGATVFIPKEQGTLEGPVNKEVGSPRFPEDLNAAFLSAKESDNTKVRPASPDFKHGSVDKPITVSSSSEETSDETLPSSPDTAKDTIQTDVVARLAGMHIAGNERHGRSSAFIGQSAYNEDHDLSVFKSYSSESRSDYDDLSKTSGSGSGELRHETAAIKPTRKEMQKVPVSPVSRPQESIRPVASGSPRIDSVSSADSGKSRRSGPYIASIQKLKEHASKRRSRNSMLMQERFRMSSSTLENDESDDGLDDLFPRKLSEEENVVPNSTSVLGDKVRYRPPLSPTKNVPASQPPEHMVIAIRLLRAHKVHVDRIMEILRMEMDALRDFDQLLEESGRPTEEEVLDYFESVGLCLDQRSQTSAQLQHELDRISRGSPVED
ncbi:hypothetical protein FisN_14Lh284 [Fistulifera solaris]|uniref:CLASP N-terminal domain-containing protein n=1 Tax=Fistulifera solaris TaxID=1519565 RepID=A0A1Z5J9T2_FISSO|nr:hypothetical protein FisN_14Lh284 [Fistulifera solaris]|eukprot:GAX10764.1 hypothetical protein FisN_14Lh284 [Fistulifera solaris]